MIDKEPLADQTPPEHGILASERGAIETSIHVQAHAYGQFGMVATPNMLIKANRNQDLFIERQKEKKERPPKPPSRPNARIGGIALRAT